MPQTDNQTALEAIHQNDGSVIVNNAPTFMYNPIFSIRENQKIIKA